MLIQCTSVLQQRYQKNIEQGSSACLLHIYTLKITIAQGRDVRLVSCLALQQHSGFTILPELRTVLTATALVAHNNTN